MKPGRTLDLEIANKVMGLKITDSEKVPHYSTNTYEAYNVISQLQLRGWSCRIGSHISKNGALTYKAEFSRGNQYSEGRSPSISMSVCYAAMTVVKEEYTEYIKKETDDEPIKIVGSVSKSGLHTIDLDDEILEEMISEEIKLFKLPSINNLTFQDILTEPDLEKLPKAIAEFLIDILRKNSYYISKKIDD